MKKMWLFLLLFPLLANAQNKRIVLGSGDPRYPQVWYTNVAGQLNPQPGDTLVVPTGIHSAYLVGFAGTATKPIVLVPQDSGWIGGYGSYAFGISHATFFKVCGFHIDGKDSSNLLLYIGQQTSDYEVCRNEFKNSASEGLICKANPDSLSPLDYYPNWTIKNVSIHDNYVHNCVNENYYLGYTNDVVKPLAPLFSNLSVYNNRSDSSYYMGFVLSDIQGLHFHDNTVSNFGLSNSWGYQNGVCVGNVTLADSAYNITISNGTGAGLLMLPARGLWKLRNWTLTGCGKATGQDAIYIDDRPDIGYNLPALQLDLNRVFVTGASRYALNVINSYGTIQPGTISNFIYSGTASGIYDKIDKFVVAAKVLISVSTSLVAGRYTAVLTYSDGTIQTIQ